jgi:hypothetical protein
MRKFAANYIVSESGVFLKNGILIAEDDGTVLEYIDTLGKFEEIAQLIFYNGILMGGFTFVKVREALPVFDFDHRFSSLVLPGIAGKNEITIQHWLETCKQIAAYFPDMMIPEIFKEITDIFCSEGGFEKEYNSGIYLLTGADLIVLKFSMNSRLKRIL